MYECQSCGYRFSEPESYREGREYGYEEMTGCPHCGGGYIKVEEDAENDLFS